MTYRTYTHRSSFFWDSKLPDERKDEIVEWVKELSDDNAELLEDLLQDERLSTEFEAFVE